MKKIHCHLTKTVVFLCFFLLFMSTVQAAPVISEKIFFLSEDGQSFIRYDTVRTKQSSYNIWFKKQFSQTPELYLNDHLYIYPNEYLWDIETENSYDLMKIASGSFASLIQGKLDENSELSISKDGIYTYKSWDGTTMMAGDHFGIWNKPDNFTQLVYAWVFPQNFNIISYKSNREGKWVKRNNTITYYGNDVNDLTFAIKYQPVNNIIYKELLKEINKRDSNSDSNNTGSNNTDSNNAMAQLEQQVSRGLSEREVIDSSEKKIITKEGKNSEQNETLNQTSSQNSDQKQQGDPDQDQIQLEQDIRGIKITLAATVLFSSGSSDLSKRGAIILKRLSGILAKRDDLNIIIEGHSDNIPIKGDLAKKYKTNWELSSTRSLTVLHYLADHNINESRLESRALGSQRPISSNDTKKSRSKNRRIEIILVPIMDHKIKNNG